MSSPSEPSVYEGTVYRGSRDWAFKICRSGYDVLAQQDGFATRQDAQTECRRQLANYDPTAKLINHYTFQATLELTVEGDSLEQAEEEARKRLLRAFEAVDELWWSSDGPNRCSMTWVQHRYEE